MRSFRRAFLTRTVHERLLVTGVSGNVDIGSFSNFQSGSTTAPHWRVLPDRGCRPDDPRLRSTLTPSLPGIQTPETLGNAAGQTASGTFGYNIGTDDHLAAFYTAGGSDFVDTNLTSQVCRST